LKPPVLIPENFLEILMRPTQFSLKPLAVFFCAALLLPTAGMAQPDHPDGPEHCGMMPPPPLFPDDKFMEGPLPPFLHGLDLTEPQRDAVFDILHAQAPLLRNRVNALHKGDEALRSLALSTEYDENKARGLIEENAANMAEIALLRVQGEHQIYAVLTAAQRKQVAERKPREDKKPMGACENKSKVSFKML
jgi:Spy/CpxP family protein refolding chaperone